MASVFGHMAAALGIASAQTRIKTDWLILRAMLYCSLIPDLDVLAFKLGVPYESIWGHRGFTHSLLFSVLLGGIVAHIIQRSRKLNGQASLWIWLLMSLCALSHCYSMR